MRPYYILIEGEDLSIIVRNQWHDWMDTPLSLIDLSRSRHHNRVEYRIALIGFQLVFMLNDKE